MLLNLSLPFAQEMLDKHGEFFPYGAAVTTDGNPRLISASPAGGEQPTSANVLATLVEDLRSQRHGLRAAAVVSDVRAADSDAVRLELEHREGASVAVLVPYRKNSSREGGVEYGSPVAVPESLQLWVHR